MDEELLLSDDLAPNDGEAFQPDASEAVDEQEQEVLDQERAIISSATPIWEDLNKWLDDGILAADSVEQVLKTVALYKCTADQALVAHDIVRKLLEQKKVDLTALYEVYVKH